MAGPLDPAVPPATVAGLDLVRDAEGEFRVLEDNLRMPSGSTYAMAAREAVAPAIEAATEPAPPGRLRGGARGSDPRRRAGRPRRPGGRDPLRRPRLGARYEHERLAREIGSRSSSPASSSRPWPRLAARARAVPGRRPLPPHRRGPAVDARAAASPRSASCCCRRYAAAGCAASTPSAPASPTTSSRTRTLRRWCASTWASSHYCARCRASTSATPTTARRRWAGSRIWW